MTRSFSTVLSAALLAAALSGVVTATPVRAARDDGPRQLAPAFTPPAEYAGKVGPQKSPLVFNDGRPVTDAAGWQRRRREILDDWTAVMGPWPALLDRPRIDYLKAERRETFTQHRVRVQVAKTQFVEGWLLVPDGDGPFPAVLVPFYEPETSVGLNPKSTLRDFGLQLARRGFVTLSIGPPGGDARRPDTAGAACQPLSYLAYLAANCHTALAQHPRIDPARIGIVGHSYGGKWALFAACLHDKFAAAAWSDPGVVFDETRTNVNYWEPWYLGRDPAFERKPGLPTPANPRTGAYKQLVAAGRDLHELQSLMSPRPFLVSGGAEDPAARWLALNHVLAVNTLLGRPNRVAMTTRPTHDPTPESNEMIYMFLAEFLSPAAR